MSKTALFGKRKNISADMKGLGDGALKVLEIFKIFQISLIFSFQLLRSTLYCFLINVLEIYMKFKFSICKVKLCICFIAIIF